MTLGDQSRLALFLNRVKTAHMIGIGGVGMSGLAMLLKQNGIEVNGCDRTHGPVLDRLDAVGIECIVGHEPSHVKGAELVVVTSAVKRDHPEVKAAIEAGRMVVSRGELLAALTRRRELVAVAGAHGKTTTTSMIARAAVKLGMDPGVAVGGFDKFLSANARNGQGDLFVAEADESDGSFLLLQPSIAVITGIDPEHLDYWNTAEAYRRAFYEFMDKVPFYGAAVLCFDDPHLQRIQTKRNVISYSLGGNDATWTAEEPRVGPDGTRFVPVYRGEKLSEVHLKCPGRHNAANALAAMAALVVLGVEPDTAARALDGYEGVKRRFEVLGEAGRVLVVDDYGHHPLELAAVLSAARNAYPGRRIVVAFQPHLFTRTRDNYLEFAEVLGAADQVFLAPVYPAREEPIPGVDSHLIADRFGEHGPEVRVFEAVDGMAEDILDAVRPGDVVLTVGAGDVWKVGRRLLELLSERNGEAAGG